jgi:hypothetical protein
MVNLVKKCSILEHPYGTLSMDCQIFRKFVQGRPSLWWLEKSHGGLFPPKKPEILQLQCVLSIYSTPRLTQQCLLGSKQPLLVS